MVTSHAPLLERRGPEPSGRTIVSSDRLLWAALGSIGVSLLFRPALGRMVRRTVAGAMVPLLVAGVVNRLRKARRLGART